MWLQTKNCQLPANKTTARNTGKNECSKVLFLELCKDDLSQIGEKRSPIFSASLWLMTYFTLPSNTRCYSVICLLSHDFRNIKLLWYRERGEWNQGLSSLSRGTLIDLLSTIFWGSTLFNRSAEKERFERCQILSKGLFTRKFSRRDDFRPGMNSSRYLVIFFLLFTWFQPGLTSSRDDFMPVLSTGMECLPGMKRGKKCRVNGLPGMKVPCVNSVFEGMGEMNSTRAGRSQDENTHEKQKFYHSRTKFIPGWNSSQFPCKWALRQWVITPHTQKKNCDVTVTWATLGS